MFEISWSYFERFDLQVDDKKMLIAISKNWLFKNIVFVDQTIQHSFMKENRTFYFHQTWAIDTSIDIKCPSKFL